MAKKSSCPFPVGALCTRPQREAVLEGSSAALSSPKCGVFQGEPFQDLFQQAVERHSLPREQAGTKEALSYTLHYPGQFSPSAPPLGGASTGNSAAKLGDPKPSKVTQTHPGAGAEPVRSLHQGRRLKLSDGIKMTSCAPSTMNQSWRNGTIPCLLKVSQRPGPTSTSFAHSKEMGRANCRGN